MEAYYLFRFSALGYLCVGIRGAAFDEAAALMPLSFVTQRGQHEEVMSNDLTQHVQEEEDPLRHDTQAKCAA